MKFFNKSNKQKDQVFFDNLNSPDTRASLEFRKKLENTIDQKISRHESKGISNLYAFVFIQNILHSKVKLFVALTVLPTIAIVLALALYLSSNSPTKKIEDQTTQETSYAKILRIDGKATLTNSRNELGEATIDQKLYTGDILNTTPQGRVIVELEDGSQMRMDFSTTIKLKAIGKDEYNFDLISGSIYARVTKSNERKYVVNATEYEYTAKGTAFLVSILDSKSLLQVYESSVQVKTQVADYLVTEGNAKDIIDEIVPIVYEDISTDFMTWNRTLDEGSFSQNLGILSADRLPVKPEEVETEEITDETKPKVSDIKDTPNIPDEPDPKVYPTGPAPYFPGYFRAAYQEFGAWLEANPDKECAATLGDITLTNGTVIKLRLCYPMASSIMAVQYIEGYGGVPNGNFHPTPVVPVIIPNSSAISGNYVKYDNMNVSYTGSTGNSIRWASDEFIDSLIAAGII